MVIKFKKAKDIDFAGLWPVFSKAEYALLANQELVLSAEQTKRLRANKFLNLAGYQVPIDTVIFMEKSLQADQAEVQEIVEKKFINSDDVVDVLFAGMESNKNVILWGRGGHGKSEMTELILGEMLERGIIDEEPFVQAFGDGLTEEKLFGGMNIRKYKDEGVIEFLPKNSFMNYKYVVFEEIFDAPASVLLSLKDIMTSGKFRQGTEVFNIRTEMIIGLTNRSKRDFAEKDDSLMALAERFALTLKVEWESYKKVDFLRLFKTVLGNEVYSNHTEKLSMLANIIDLNNAGGSTFVSPRTAISAAQLFIKGKKLEYISDIDPEILIKYDQAKQEAKFDKLHVSLLENIGEYLDDNKIETVDQNEDFLNELNEIEIELGEEPIDIPISTTTKQEKEAKLRKAKFLLAIIDRINIQGKQYKSFTQMKGRINETIKLINHDLNPTEATEATGYGEEVTEENETKS